MRTRAALGWKALPLVPFLLLVVGTTGSSAAAPVRATRLEPTSAAAAEPVGEAKVSSYSLRLAPAIGGTALTMTFGGAGALLQNASGTGIAAAADFGLIATVFEGGACGFKSPGGFFPPPTLLTNQDGDASGHHDVVPVADGAGGGRQDVVVTREPRVDAKVAMSGLDLGDAASLRGIRASSVATNPDGATPTGEAFTQSDLVLPGLLEVRDMRWEAQQKGGGEPGTASFSYTSGTVLGTPMPANDAPAFEEAANTLLGPLGLHLVMPHLERIAGSSPIVRVTPMVIGYGGSPVVNTVLDPLLELSRSLKEQLVEAVADSCFSSYGALFVDLGLGLLLGTGQLNLLVGGVEVVTNDDQFIDPFGTAPLPAPEVADVLPPDGALPAATPGTVAAPTGSGGSPVAAGRSGLIGTLCESVHPNRAPSCSGGAAAAAGALAVVAVVAAAAGDVVIRRRRGAAAS